MRIIPNRYDEYDPDNPLNDFRSCNGEQCFCIKCNDGVVHAKNLSSTFINDLKKNIVFLNYYLNNLNTSTRDFNAELLQGPNNNLINYVGTSINGTYTNMYEYMYLNDDILSQSCIKSVLPFKVVSCLVLFYNIVPETCAKPIKYILSENTLNLFLIIAALQNTERKIISLAILARTLSLITEYPKHKAYKTCLKYIKHAKKYCAFEFYCKIKSFVYFNEYEKPTINDLSINILWAADTEKKDTELSLLGKYNIKVDINYINVLNKFYYLNPPHLKPVLQLIKYTNINLILHFIKVVRIVLHDDSIDIDDYNSVLYSNVSISLEKSNETQPLNTNDQEMDLIYNPYDLTRGAPDFSSFN